MKEHHLLHTGHKIEQRDAENVRHPQSRSATLRKPIKMVLLVVLGALMLAAYAYQRSTYLGSTHWRLFWGYEMIFGVAIILGVVRTRKKRQKL